ncbi:hypothetical protein ASN86_01643 [Streptococcus parauberis]|nr:hypothetical protein ASN86_01643 [Streptococcus parauberis]
MSQLQSHQSDSEISSIIKKEDYYWKNSQLKQSV